MRKLPALTARDVIRALKRAGFIENRQKGSHLILIHPETKKRTVVPVHQGKTINKPLLVAIIHDAGITIKDFLALV